MKIKDYDGSDLNLLGGDQADNTINDIWNTVWYVTWVEIWNTIYLKMSDARIMIN